MVLYLTLFVKFCNFVLKINYMDDLFNKEVIASTKKVLDNLQNELDKTYCTENGIVFSNNEVDMAKNDLVSKSAMDAAFQLLTQK